MGPNNSSPAEPQAGSVRRVKITDLLLAAPIFHLICASLFLIGYCWYFGGAISSFIGPADVFSVSIGDTGPLYLFIILPATIYILWMRARIGAWTSAEAVARKPEGPERAMAQRKHESDKRFFTGLFGLVALSVILDGAVNYFRWGFIPLSVVQLIALVIFIFLNVYLANKLDIASPTFQLIYLVGFDICVFRGHVARPSRLAGDV